MANGPIAATEDADANVILVMPLRSYKSLGSRQLFLIKSLAALLVLQVGRTFKVEKTRFTPEPAGPINEAEFLAIFQTVSELAIRDAEIAGIIEHDLAYESRLPPDAKAP